MLRKCIILIQAISLCWLVTMSKADIVDSLPTNKQLHTTKQIKAKPTMLDTLQDHKSEETGSQHMFGGGGGGGGIGIASGGHGKYFQDMYSLQYGPEEWEFGHVCETPSEWEQHYERKDHKKRHYIGQLEFGHVAETPSNWEQQFQRNNDLRKRYQGKARWGDKHGGYGEHYWDYNHGGHHHDGAAGGGGGHDEEQEEDEGDGGYSHHVPEFVTPSESDSSGGIGTKHHSHQDTPSGASEERVKRQPNTPVARVIGHGQSVSAASASPVAMPLTPIALEGPLALIYDIDTGTVVNEATGQTYILHPVN